MQDVTRQALKQASERTTMAPVKRSKYNARKTTVDGIVFDSAKEAKRYGELMLRGCAGDLRNLELQPRFPLHVGEGDPREIGAYVADFAYEESDRGYGAVAWTMVVEDVKGFKTPLYRWKKRHVEKQYGIQIREV